ncbi:MAG TPA: DUF2079 domain-containing protein [Myxococcota bacterium]|jgi:uncharacterized membrane protein
MTRSAWLAALVPGALAFVLFTVFSVNRHERFGSGSWDMGCHVHNLFLLSHAVPKVSSVLGDANFWGGTNHFMPSEVLLAPLSFTGATWILLVVQALLVSLAVIPLAFIAWRRALGPVVIAGVSTAYLLAVGTQTFIEFDVHETAGVPLLTFLAILGYERVVDGKRFGRALAWTSLVVLAGTKESSILYAAAVGLWLALLPPRPRAFDVGARAPASARVEGALLFALFLAWFFVVTAVIQPAFLEAGASMIHVARFRALGSSFRDVIVAIALHPLHALALLVSPAPKAQTLAITGGGFAFLALLSPASWILAAPNLVERFLSDKREMWTLGFHYSLPLVGLCAYGAVDALARLRTVFRQRAFDAVAGAVLVLACFASNAAAPFPPELATLNKSYMADDATIDRYHRALALIPDNAKVAAQNHLLPHLANRQFIWQPLAKYILRADYIILDSRGSPWPQTQAQVARTIATLRADSGYTSIFDEQGTVVFQRTAP